MFLEQNCVYSFNFNNPNNTTTQQQSQFVFLQKNLVIKKLGVTIFATKNTHNISITLKKIFDFETRLIITTKKSYNFPLMKTNPTLHILRQTNSSHP